VIELAQFVKDFAVAIELADGRGPQAVGSRGGRAYQPGIGPHTESQTIRLVADELVALDLVYAAQSFGVAYLARRGSIVTGAWAHLRCGIG
jgi:hypothetical protein